MKNETQIITLLQILLEKIHLTESEAFSVADLYPEWQPNKNYVAGMIFRHGVNSKGYVQLWRVYKNHISNSKYTPEYDLEHNYSNLYCKLRFDMNNNVDLWVKPSCEKQGYQKGDMVSFNGVVYESIANNNMFSPDESDWKRKEDRK